MTLDFDILWRLQTCETNAQAVADRLARMPQAVERAGKELEIREGELKAREGQGQDLAKKRRAIEKDVEAFEEKIRDNAVRQGKARTNAELDAMKKEAVFLREQKSALETQVLELFDLEETHKAKVKAAKDEVDRAKAVLAERQKEMDTRAAGDRVELQKLQDERRALAEMLPPQVRSRFDQIARAKHGLAVVSVQRGACGGCFNALPPQFVNEVRKAENLMICEGCGRIVVWNESADNGQ